MIVRHSGVSKLNGSPGRGSGRYPLGSGDRPYQNQPQLRQKASRWGVIGSAKQYVRTKSKIQETRQKIMDLQSEISSAGIGGYSQEDVEEMEKFLETTEGKRELLEVAKLMDDNNLLEKSVVNKSDKINLFDEKLYEFENKINSTLDKKIKDLKGKAKWLKGIVGGGLGGFIVKKFLK